MLSMFRCNHHRCHPNHHHHHHHLHRHHQLDHQVFITLEKDWNTVWGRHPPITHTSKICIISKCKKCVSLSALSKWNVNVKNVFCFHLNGYIIKGAITIDDSQVAITKASLRANDFCIIDCVSAHLFIIIVIIIIFNYHHCCYHQLCLCSPNIMIVIFIIFNFELKRNYLLWCALSHG